MKKRYRGNVPLASAAHQIVAAKTPPRSGELPPSPPVYAHTRTKNIAI